VSSVSDGARKGLRLSGSSGDGVAYLRGIEFGNGTIESDIRGKDLQDKVSSVFAFHGVDGAPFTPP
jgi:hypothetical protein